MAHFITTIYNNIEFPLYPHSIDFWKKGKNLIIEHFDKAGFVKVDHIAPYDSIIFNLGDTKIPNHIAIYFGDGLIGHHLAGKTSRREPLKPFMDNLACVLRHKKYA